MPKYLSFRLIPGLLIATLLFIAPAALAQRSKSTLSGIVAENSGAIMPKAKVEFMNEGTNVRTGIVVRMATDLRLVPDWF